MKQTTEGTKVLKCTCAHEEQDKMYGKGMRLHNRVDGKGKPLGYACTVCTPRYQQGERNTVAIAANPAFGNSFVPPRKLRNLKQA